MEDGAWHEASHLHVQPQQVLGAVDVDERLCSVLLLLLAVLFALILVQQQRTQRLSRLRWINSECETGRLIRVTHHDHGYQGTRETDQ